MCLLHLSRAYTQEVFLFGCEVDALHPQRRLEKESGWLCQSRWLKCHKSSPTRRIWGILECVVYLCSTIHIHALRRAIHAAGRDKHSKPYQSILQILFSSVLQWRVEQQPSKVFWFAPLGTGVQGSKRFEQSRQDERYRYTAETTCHKTRYTNLPFQDPFRQQEYNSAFYTRCLQAS